MPFTVEQFVDSLSSSGLMSRDEIDVLRKRIASMTTVTDGIVLAREFVRLGKLTEFQAGILCSARTQRLVVGEYVILDALGSGSMGHVFRAEHRRMRRVVAIKVLSATASLSPQAKERFLREARALARLEHPHIVSAYDAGDCDGTHYLVMQYVDGWDLEFQVRERGRLPVDRALDFILQAAEALEYAHSQGVIHRDVKPSNLLVDRAGSIKLLDLGLALLEENVGATGRTVSGRLTHEGQALGTADFISPEQADDTRDADHRSDIYSLGCTLYYLLLGESPFQRDTVTNTLMAHRDAPIPSLSAGRIAGATPELDAAFARMLAKRPDDRFQSMGEAITALGSCGVPLATRPERSSAAPPADRGRMQRLPGTISESSSPTDGRIEISSATASLASSSTRDLGEGAVDSSQSADWGSHQLSDWSLDREVAQWVLLIGGSVVVCRGEKRVAVKHMDSLPNGMFQLETIGLEYNRLVTDSDLARFSSLTGLRRLYLHGTDVTDDGLSHLVDIATLTDLSLGKSRITDRALPALARMTGLKHLSLHGTAVSDSGLPHLATLERLESLNLVGSRASAEGVSALHATLPRCRIASV
jgi:serine/threonine protein kinase